MVDYKELADTAAKQMIEEKTSILVDKIKMLHKEYELSFESLKYPLEDMEKKVKILEDLMKRIKDVRAGDLSTL